MTQANENLRIIIAGLDRIPMSDKPVELYDPIRYILALGGKRLRPMLTLLCSNYYKDDIQAALPAALAIEVFHNFTLLHDDIMDKAPLRRNKPTVHEKWNANVAILSGDAMLIKAYELLAGVDKSLLPSVLAVFNQTALEVCEGQQYDMNFERRTLVSEDEYLRMIELKTAVLIAAAMKIGAICGGAPESDQHLLYQAGRYLGLAFQLQDDWLDSFGKTETFGKSIGGDIAACKKTWLYIKTLELASADDRAFLLHAYSKPSENPGEKIQNVTALFLKYGVNRLAEEKIQEFTSIAIANIKQLTVDVQKLQSLYKLVENLTSRDS